MKTYFQSVQSKIVHCYSASMRDGGPNWFDIDYYTCIENIVARSRSVLEVTLTICISSVTQKLINQHKAVLAAFLVSGMSVSMVTLCHARDHFFLFSISQHLPPFQICPIFSMMYYCKPTNFCVLFL